MKKIKLKVYPYTYVRATVMRSLLTKREDYLRLIKMDLNSIIKFLEESVCKKEIDRLLAEYSGMDLIEIALNENLAASFNKLRRISSPEIRLLIDAYSKRKDIENIKTILRAKYTKTSESELKKLISSAGTFEYSFFVELFKMESTEQILKNIKVIPFDSLQKGYESFLKENNLSGIESALDRFYYHELIDFSKLIPKQGKMFREFLEKEIEIINIRTLFKLNREKINKEEIKNYLILDGKLSHHLAGSANMDDLIDRLGKTKYGSTLKDGIEKLKKENTLIDLEIALYNQLLKQSTLLLHQHPLSVDVILGYLFAKEIEIRNLKIITKGKQLGLSESFIEQQMVML